MSKCCLCLTSQSLWYAVGSAVVFVLLARVGGTIIYCLRVLFTSFAAAIVLDNGPAIKSFVQRSGSCPNIPAAVWERCILQNALKYLLAL